MSGGVGQNTASSVSRRWVMWQKKKNHRLPRCHLLVCEGRIKRFALEKSYFKVWTCEAAGRIHTAGSSSSTSLAKIVQENFEEGDIFSTSLMMDGCLRASISLLNWQQTPAKSPQRDVSPEIYTQNSQGREDTACNSIIWFEFELFLERLFYSRVARNQHKGQMKQQPLSAATCADQDYLGMSSSLMKWNILAIMTSVELGERELRESLR